VTRCQENPIKFLEEEEGEGIILGKSKEDRKRPFFITKN